MRIRTIKPEFWLNEELARLGDFPRLLALGLLNYADDDGLFDANPALIRGQLFPFEEDSSRIQRALTDLSNIRFVLLRTGTNGRIYGQVAKFGIHQRIDRPSTSKIKPLVNFDEDASSPQRALALGTGNREQGSGTGNMDQGAVAPAVEKPASTERKKPERPTIEDWLAYGHSLSPDWPPANQRGAFDHYEANGWRQASGNTVKDWKACCRTCFQRWQQEPRRGGTVARISNPLHTPAVSAEEHRAGFFGSGNDQPK